MNAPKSSRAKKANPAPSTVSLSAFDKAIDGLRHSPGAFPTISPRWLAGAAATAVLGALACAWLTLCLLFWQGSWQLLYHPKAAIARTPANIGLAFEPVKFAVTETGTPQLSGWWLPAENARFNVLYLHGARGNLGDTLDTLAALHRQNLSVFAIDYRGYGQSLPAKPSEKRLHQDAESALAWLTVTRNLPADTVLIAGSGLGANLAAAIAAEPATSHSQLAGVILDQPSDKIMDPVFEDRRSHLVPAHWLVQDRYDLATPASALKIPSLWLLAQPPPHQAATPPAAYAVISTQKSAAWLIPPIATGPAFAETLRRWLDDLR